ncbi:MULTISPECIES: ferrochelatase [unclassified Lentimonas]|uniref:ferrochelatase n=2 Tax=unclassified Lentimonas TaxID=2630993 RepID=UPI0013224E8A|nr:Ferrochelatase, protoheme ferro-lyase (EC [Lentimonas sp. CC4]CAA6683619.1 Ferrochelatase, protoheme ferro-lyase (EC [Lentimonas sp. CC6]CAA7074534.1 Ferrochelatase, protoheme ferro-lyase (EC [Lentimonas sp. CC4]CAA7169150.1 Ferrochelatase, protoheme ferro-lyase (EC [Lentimonas sp. CC21]CAA7180449.1 Ferrochelatase, protoheme ferro-lyase (EC [Lentimonas sp. CC8]
MRMSKQGVILLNLGSPDSTQVSDVRKYLGEFLMDGRVLDAPFAIRWFLVNCLILPKRPKQSAEAYSKIWLDEGSPLILTSIAQQKALAEQVDVPVALGMRYGSPSTEGALQELLDQGVDDVFIVPMYPHYAMSSYETAVVHLMESVRKLKPDLKTTLMPPFYQDPDYIAALVERSRADLVEGSYDKLVFSFHGIPQRHLVKGDPSHSHCMTTPDCCNTCHPAHATCYRHQCAMTVEKFVAALNIPKDKYMITFQSRLGREPWLHPYTDQTLEQLAEEGHKRVKVICASFTADCLETLEEIAQEGRDTFIEAGGEDLHQIPCVNEHPKFIEFLRNKVTAWQSGAYETAHATPPAYVAK